MTVDTVVRRAELGETDALYDLHVRALRPTGALAEEWAESDVRDVDSDYFDAGNELLVAERDGEAVGMGAFHREDDATAEVTWMRVDPDHQRQGVGQAVYDELERRARERGYEAFVLHTTRRQTAAQAFYETNGYARQESFEWREYEVLRYRKDL